ncbi:hypothetical protein D3C76_1326830 [compost metagenome]
MCAKFGSSSTTRIQRTVKGALRRSSANRAISWTTAGATAMGATEVGAWVGMACIRSTGSSPGSTYCCGRIRLNWLPCPGVLETLIEPPSSAARSREIDRPRPVPP